ncbi:hypothetical protein [Bacteriophage sp.]|nr:hypothetical protein [Bacteriophage sp.]
MGTVVLNGATSGATTLVPTDAVTATLTLPSTTGTLVTTTTQAIKKISTYEYATRTNCGASIGVGFTWTTSFTMVDRVNNSLLVMSWIPMNDGTNSYDFSGYGLRFTNGSSNYDTQGKGSNYCGFPGGSLAMSISQYGFWVSPNSVPTGTLTLQHYLYATSSGGLVCPNSSDDSRLNQTAAELIIIEYGA